MKNAMLKQDELLVYVRSGQSLDSQRRLDKARNRSGQALDWEDIEDEAVSLINDVPYAGFGERT